MMTNFLAFSQKIMKSHVNDSTPLQLRALLFLPLCCIIQQIIKPKSLYKSSCSVVYSKLYSVLPVVDFCDLLAVISCSFVLILNIMLKAIKRPLNDSMQTISDLAPRTLLELFIFTLCKTADRKKECLIS